MAETVITASNGGTYHLFALSCEAREPADSVMFDEIVHTFPGGSIAQTLIGPQGGTRAWELPLPSLKGYSTSVATFQGVDYTYADYIRNLFLWQKRTGQPFVLQSSHNNQYYFVRFADNADTFKKKLASIWETSLRLVQVRVAGVSIFDINKLDDLYGWFEPEHDDGGWDNTGGVWTNLITASNADLTRTGGTSTSLQTNQQNGLSVVRLNSGTANTFLTTFTDPTISEAVFVMKVREATFSADVGILTADAAFPLLLGDTGETKFQNLDINSSSEYAYRYNGIDKTEATQTAPMNEFGLLHLRFPAAGFTIDQLQIGKNGTTAGTFALIDIGTIIFSSSRFSQEVMVELTEHLMTKWALS